MIINDAGEYTLKYTATDACGNSTVVERGLTVEAPPIYGAVWDGSSSPQWTRTQLAADFSDPQPAVNNGTGSSPFDDIMPWSGMQIVEDAEAGTLVSIPKFYFKWIRDGLSMELQISPNQQDGFHVSPAHADRGDGVGERDVVYVGRYHCSATNYKSITGTLPKAEITRDAFRRNIHALGNTVWQYDFAMYWTIAMLYIVEFANWNSQSCIGYGCGNNSSTVNMGATDSMQYHTGTNVADRTTQGEVQYRHIEGLWSNVLDFCDGIYFSDRDIYIVKNPSEFSDTSGGTNVGLRAPNSRGVPEAFTAPTQSGYEYALYPSSTFGTNYAEHVCDTCSYNSLSPTLMVGGDFEKSAQNGLFRMTASNNVSWANINIGSRLQKLP